MHCGWMLTLLHVADLCCFQAAGMATLRVKGMRATQSSLQTGCR